MRKLEGLLTQGAADALIIDYRDTGAKQSSFQGIRPLYVRFLLYNDNVSGWPAATSYTVESIGFQSNDRLFMSGALVGTGLLLDRIKEWWLPANMPIQFDEQVAIAFDTAGSGIVNQVEYVFCYEIVQSNELFMVQQLAQY